MSYIALARKWRPRTFSQLVGQEHITRALSNSLSQQRLHHAYLFTGTRGVGKTSVARLLAKALNCERGVQNEPCLQCETCLAIEKGSFIDLIEIDGASRTRVEDTRELLDNVQYAPTSGRFKIYLIDEVHMLSQHSFNALLKTLEEPPTHIKFLLATTDPQKLPLTILSRCLQFHLNPLPADLICQHLQSILQAEQLSFETEALTLLAKTARGSMRDALSLLDQAIVSSPDHLDVTIIRRTLGHTQQDYALDLLGALAELNPQKLIAISRQIASEGGSFLYVLEEMLGYLHEIAISQSIPESPLLSSSPEILNLSTQFSPEDTQLFYQIALKGSKEIELAPTFAIGFEMTLLRMYAFRPAPEVAIPPLAHQMCQEQTPVEFNRRGALPNAHTPENRSITATPTEEQPISALSKDTCADQAAAAPAMIKNKDKDEVEPLVWNKILPKLKLSGLALSAIEHSEWVSKKNAEVTLRVDKGHQSLFTAAVISRIEQALSNHYKEPIKLILCYDTVVSASPAQQKKEIQVRQQQDAEIALQTDPFFQQLQQEFTAEVVKNSIVLLQDDL